MVKKILQFLIRTLIVLLIGVLLVLGLPTILSELYARSRMFTTTNAPTKPVAIIFGAGLMRDGSPTPILRDRVTTAANLFFQGKVNKLLMSGDNRFVDYNEPGAMRQFALGLGVPESAIVLDFAGRRTYDTCYRAKHIFKVSEALLITQKFHLPRALLTCNGLGVNALGVLADLREYNRHSMRIWRIREMAATSMALIDVYFTRPLPVLGTPEPIFPLEASHPASAAHGLEQ